MTQLLYLTDSYLKECTATVTNVYSGTDIVLDKTIFYPAGGGQPTDFGTMDFQGKVFILNEAKKHGSDVYHSLDRPGLEVGQVVVCRLDWARRYELMRMHTAAHVLGGVMHEKGWLITGNQLDTRQSRIDFSMESFDRPAFDEIIRRANDLLATHAAVKSYELEREKAMAIPGVVKLANALPPDVKMLRIVEIEGVDTQADAGTHVLNTSEVGTIVVERLENKGAKNKRVYFTLD